VVDQVPRCGQFQPRQFGAAVLIQDPHQDAVAGDIVRT
jgi:hypothetical protein